MGGSPYPQQQQQQPYGQAPYPSQQPYVQQPYPQQQQQPYPQQQQQPYQQQAPYPQQQQQAAQDNRTAHHFGQSSMNQHYSTPGQTPYMPPTTYSPQPQAGRKKALLIGCAYPGTSQALNGCINDVQCIEYCLKHRFGFVQPGSIVVLRDDQRSPDHVSTRANILRGIQWLMHDQQ
jgi:hypothetical protein